MKPFLLNGWTWILLLVALIPRLLDLDQFITSDENTNIFFAGSAVVQAFLQGNFRETYWHFYPGVTMSWADGLGMASQWLLETLAGTTNQPLSDYVFNDIRDLLVAARLPYVILTAVFVPVTFHFLRQWLAGPTPETRTDIATPLSLAAALLIAFDPFFLAHSRVVHGDAPVTVFMIVSTLSLVIYFRRRSWALLLLSAISGSFAALTKAPGQLMAPLIIILCLSDWLIQSARLKRLDGVLGQRRLVDIVAWGTIALLTMFILWPSMWVDPLGTIQQMLDETFGKVNEGHLVFYQGQPTLDPGPWFYPWVIPFRLTPVTSSGLVLGLGLTGFLSWQVQRRSASSAQIKLLALSLTLAFFILFLILSGNLSPKKQDRYLLPVYPVIDILAALGWFGLLTWISSYFGGQRLIQIGLGLLVVLQLAGILPHHPYYLTYFNPLMGGLSRAVETTLVGWGEGMDQVAAYLNQKPNAAQLYVASTPSQTLLPYFDGQGENFYTNDVAMRADYVVIYRAQQQRLAPSPDIVRYYLEQEPEHVVTLQAVPYAWIFKNERLIFADVPLQANLTNIGFGDSMRLAGYQVETKGQDLVVDLFWHALPAIEQAVGPCQEVRVENIESTICPRLDYTVSLRLLDNAGTVVAQHDSWPANGLLPTGQWRVDDYIQDRHILPLPDPSSAEYQLAVVVYHHESQAVLAGPISFATVALP